MIWIFLAMVGLWIWFFILILPWHPMSTREFLDAGAPAPEENLSDISVLIPARNEADVIKISLTGLKVQGSNLNIILIDDNSTDGTAYLARELLKYNLRIISGKPLEPGWSGKLWALEQGICHIDTRFTLLVDADIELQPGILPALYKMMMENDLHFVSLMPALRMISFWEKLLMPTFIYFFKLLYPFSLSNSSFPRVAAAAGGCILMETHLLDKIGAFKSLREELIDDCALAKRVKSLGYRTWIGLTHSVHSLRSYDHLSAIWNMVARNAFTQLHHSVLLLVLCTALMITVFCLPVAGFMFPSIMAKVISALALGTMILSYLPILKFYGLSRNWAIALPLIGTLYLAMTWTSAIRFWKGEGVSWKGRYYTKRQDVG